MCQTGNQTQLNFTSHGILISCHKIMVFAPLQNHFVTLMAIRKHSTTVSHEDKVHFDPIRTYEGICWEYKYPQTYSECLANNYKGGLFKLFKLNINRDHKFLPNFQIPVPRIQNALTMVSDLSIVRKQIYKKTLFSTFSDISVISCRTQKFHFHRVAHYILCCVKCDTRKMTEVWQQQGIKMATILWTLKYRGTY